ncbi:MAG: hypothetical protein AAF411_15235, partial [Myxococcota bacterium]
MRWTAVALLLLSACKAGNGDSCKENNDCSGSLICCGGNTGGRGFCQAPEAVCDTTDAGTFEAGVDAATDGAEMDGAETDAMQMDGAADMM